jgi:hypothetical protein
MLGIAESVIGVAGKVLDKFVEDKDLKTKLDAELRSQLINLRYPSSTNKSRTSQA